jgi:dimethylaniline monooxygenase (N-oxide forming)
VLEKDAELGGVWSSSRRYPGITTQNTKDTYCFSDFPMPKHFPEWPAGEQVQAYLKAYAKNFNVFPLIQFSHQVTSTNFHDNKWTISGKNAYANFTAQTDFLIVCNGTFSDPFIPQIPGIDSFLDAGGQMLHSTQFHDAETCKNKQLIVVGYGKSAADVVTEASETAKSTHLVFREPKWKIPRFIKGINMKYMILSRLGEALITPADQHNRMDRFVHSIGLPKKMLSFLEKYISKKQMLKELGLLPASGLKEQAFGEITLETPGFFEKIKKGQIITHRGEIVSLNGKQATLSDGKRVPCDMLVFAIGFRQTIPFLSNDFIEKMLDKQGNYILYRHILPPGIPSFAFMGYNTSIQCPISSEFGALWICEYLKGRVKRPTEAEVMKEGTDFIKWRSQYRPNGSSSALSTMPGTIHHVDVLLKDMNTPLPLRSLIPDWLLTINPARYKKLRKKILHKNSTSNTRQNTGRVN